MTKFPPYSWWHAAGRAILPPYSWWRSKRGRSIRAVHVEAPIATIIAAGFRLGSVRPGVTT